MEDAAIDYAVVGLGLTGRAVARYLLARGARLAAMDTRESPPEADVVRRELGDIRLVTGGLDERALLAARRIVLSPGVSRHDPLIRRAERAGADVIGDIELFAEAVDAPVIAITGTNGKSTVTTLVGEMLRAAGRDVRCGANLGTPALDLIAGPAPDCYVLELSSFQLELTRSLAPRVACVLNITPDHLDRHGSFAAYVEAKARVLLHAGSAVINVDDPVAAGLAFDGRRIGFRLATPRPGEFGLTEADGRSFLAGPGGVLVDVDGVALRGRHNLANALAAMAICDAMGALDAAALASLASFGGLEHRTERVTELAGVSFVNDSKATNPGAACAAVEGLASPGTIVLIAGGVAKGADFERFGEVVSRHVHTVVLLGEAASEIARALDDTLPVVHATNMRAAVQAAAAAARPGDTVLLSPACASFDLFENYAARGRAFRDAVKELGA